MGLSIRLSVRPSFHRFNGGVYRGFKDTGYLLFFLPWIWDKLSIYFHVYAIMGSVFNIFVTVRDIGYLEKKKIYIYQFIRDTCLFTSRDIFTLPPIQTSLYFCERNSS